MSILWYTKEVGSSEWLTVIASFEFRLLLANYYFFLHLLLSEFLQARMAGLFPIWEILLIGVFIKIFWKLDNWVSNILIIVIKLVAKGPYCFQSFLMLDQIKFVFIIFVHNDSQNLLKGLLGWIIILWVKGKGKLLGWWIRSRKWRDYLVCQFDVSGAVFFNLEDILMVLRFLQAFKWCLIYWD